MKETAIKRDTERERQRERERERERENIANNFNGKQQLQTDKTT